MAKPTTANARAYLNKATGNDPIIVVGILWSNTNLQWYATRNLSGISNFTPNIMNVGEVRVQKKTEKSSTSGAVAITFSDTDGIMKTYLDDNIIEKAPAYIYLGFVGMAPEDYILIFEGVTVSPAKWDEGERTMTINFELQVQNHELGYSATIADFPDINPEAQGVPWPIIFGTCAHVPALHIRRHTEGRLQCSIRFNQTHPYILNGNKNDISLPDNPDTYSFLLDANPAKNLLYVEDGESFPQNQQISIIINGVVFKGTMSGTKFSISKSNVPKYTNIQCNNGVNDADANNYSVLWINANPDGSYPSLVNTYCYFDGMNSTNGGPEWYNKCIKQQGGKCWFRYPFISPNSYKPKLMSNGDSITAAYGCTKNGMAQDIGGMIVDAKNKMNWRRASRGRCPFGALITQINNLAARSSCWWTAYADASVRLWNEQDPDIYIASLVTMSNIKAVYGKRTVEGGDGKTRKIFQQIPNSYYQIQYTSQYPVHSEEPGSPDFYPTGILLYKPLCDYAGQEWDDEIWVTGTSTVGPNPVDILTWIFEKFTNLEVDLGTFAQARSRTGALSANFALFENRNALSTAEDIAMQCKCGLILDSGKVQLMYLATSPLIWDYYTEDDVELKTLSVTSTPTAEVITKYIASWSETYRDKHRLAEVREKLTREFEHIMSSLVKQDRKTRADTRYTVYRNNIGLYGLRVKEDSCFIYNDEESILTYLNFWGFRFSNAWRLMTIKVPLRAVRLQPWDGVIVTFSEDYIAPGLSSVIGVIEAVSFNPNDWNCTLELWLPVTIGTSAVSYGAWPG